MLIANQDLESVKPADFPEKELEEERGDIDGFVLTLVAQAT